MKTQELCDLGRVTAQTSFSGKNENNGTSPAALQAYYENESKQCIKGTLKTPNCTCASNHSATIAVDTVLASSTSSTITSAHHPSLTFSLHLLRSEPTYNQPVQQWDFTSDFAVRDQGSYLIFLSCCLPLHSRRFRERHKCPLFFQVRDYSGTYTVKLLPCTTPSHQEYHLPVTCSPREPVTFDLDIRFQQVCLGG